jgi:hypothetical protein
MKTFTITSITDKGVVVKELNEVTNPSMGARHVNYESMLKEYELTEDSLLVNIGDIIYLTKEGVYDFPVKGRVGLIHDTESSEGKITTNEFGVYVYDLQDKIIGQDYWGAKETVKFKVDQTIQGEVVSENGIEKIKVL